MNAASGVILACCLPRLGTNEPAADQARRFCEGLERSGGCQDWQVRQAEQAVRIYLMNFLQRTDWVRRFLAYLIPASSPAACGTTSRIWLCGKKVSTR